LQIVIIERKYVAVIGYTGTCIKLIRKREYFIQ